MSTPALVITAARSHSPWGVASSFSGWLNAGALSLNLKRAGSIKAPNSVSSEPGAGQRTCNALKLINEIHDQPAKNSLTTRSSFTRVLRIINSEANSELQRPTKGTITCPKMPVFNALVSAASLYLFSFLLPPTLAVAHCPSPGGTMRRKYTMPNLRRGQVSAAQLATQATRPSSPNSRKQRTTQCLAYATYCSPIVSSVACGDNALLSGVTKEECL